MTLSTTTDHSGGIFDGIPSTLADPADDPLYVDYLRMRSGELEVVALAPSDASGARPHFNRTANLQPAGAGTFYCPRCDERGHSRAVNPDDLETCHADGWKAATVAAVESVEGRDAAKRAQAWLSRWTPAARLSVGCRTCNAEDSDWGSASQDRRCGTVCCV